VLTSAASGVPSGWAAPSGGRLNLVTVYECDPERRMTQQIGPEQTIDAAVRRSSTGYDVPGLVSRMSSFDNDFVGMGRNRKKGTL